MSKNYFLSLALVICCGMTIVSCASVPMADSSADVAAKEFKVPPGQSRLYVYRNESLGGALKMTLAIDGKIAGQTAPRTYYFWDLQPGKHEISCIGDNTVHLNVTTKRDSITYVWQEMKMGAFVAQCALNEVSEEQGKKGISESKLARQLSQ